jgi:hypothetical protein
LTRVLAHFLMSLSSPQIELTATTGGNLQSVTSVWTIRPESCGRERPTACGVKWQRE